MGCGSSRPATGDGHAGPARPENDVDVASFKDFEVEQKEAAMLASSEPSVASCMSHHEKSPSPPMEPSPSPPPPPADNISLQSVQGEHGIPPLIPPLRLRDHLIPHPSIFSHTDQRVKHTPKSATNSVTSLAFYLTSVCPFDLHDLHAVRAIFCWLALNITYDSQSYLAGIAVPQEPGSVLRCGKALCTGFARFCEVLCNLSDVPCLTVHGIAKGYSHDPETVYTADTKANHAWNLVLVQGEWHPLDCAWGTGYLQEDGRFRQEFNDHWFLTDPTDFLSTHFPYMFGQTCGNPTYQLCHRTIDITTFSTRVRLDKLAYRVGLRLLTHRNGVIDNIIEDVVIRVKAVRCRLRAVTACLMEKRDNGLKKDRSAVLTSWDNDDTWRIYVRPPSAATYYLALMGLADEQEGTTLQRLCVYALRCQKAQMDQSPFPQISGSWGLQYPMAEECGLRKVKDTTFQFEAKDGVTSVCVGLCRHTELAVKLRHSEGMEEDMARFTLVEYKADGDVCIHVRLARDGYFLLRVFASHPHLPGLQHVADYLLHANTPCHDCLPFPHSSDFAHAQRTRLIQPLVRELSRESTWLFRVHAPRLSRMRVNGLRMERGSDGMWETEVDFSEDDGISVVISGSVDKKATQLSALYTFQLV